MMAGAGTEAIAANLEITDLAKLTRSVSEAGSLRTPPTLVIVATAR
jgi:hypothetical protein